VGDPASNPFGEKPFPWWRFRRTDRLNRAPKRYAMVAGGLGPFLGLALSGVSGVNKAAWGLVVLGLTLIPPLMVELWWKGRCRRRAERLLSPQLLSSGGSPSELVFGRRDG